MAQKITIAELDIDEKAFVDAAQKSKKAIDELTASQKKLKASGDTNSKQFVKNEADLKKLRTEYNRQKNAINSLKSPYAKLSAELNTARRKAKDLAATFGVNSTQARSAAESVRVLDGKLRRIDKSVGQAQRNVGNYNSGLKSMALRFVGVAAVIGGVVRGFKDMIGRIVQFDKTMVGLSAILGVSRSEIKDLEGAIKDVAGSSINTSTQVAELATVLITLGKTKTEVIQLLKPVNDLSIALGATSAEAGELLVQTLNAFDKGTTSAQNFADIIAKMRTSTALDFERIKDALGFLAPTSNAAGVSFERTGAILGVLVDNGIKAARAGRLTSTSFLKLAADGKTLEDALDEINVAQNKGVSTTELLTVASKLFGKQGAAIGLILANNRDRVDELTGSFENAEGTLKKLTEQQLESLDAQLKILDSTWEKFILNIENGEGALAGFTKGMITFSAGTINLLDDISTTSDGFLDFFVNITRATSTLGQIQIRTEAITKKALETQAIKKQELIDLTTKQSKADGEYLTQLNFRLAEIGRMSGKEVNEAVKVFEAKKLLIKQAADAKKETEAKEKLAKETNAVEAKELTEKENKEKLKDEQKFAKTKRDLLNEIELENASGAFERKKIKIEQKLKDDVAELNALKISSIERNAFIKELTEQADADKQAVELERIATFAQQKQALENEIQLAQAETDLEKDLIKEEQAYEKHLLDLENQELKANEKNELRKLLLEQHEGEIEQIQDKYRENSIKKEAAFSKIELKTAQQIAAQKIAFQHKVTNLLSGIFGGGVAARIAALVAEAISGVIRIQGTTAAAQAANVAAAAAVGFPQNVPLIAAAKIQNVGLGASSKIAQGRLLKTAALQGAAGSFADGGQIPTLSDGKINNGANVSTLANGDDTLAYVGQGEVILNKQQQQSAGGSAFFKSIGVPGFASGGQVGIASNVSAPARNIGIDVDKLTTALASKINAVKIVAIESEITDAQNQQVEIINSANI